MQGTWVWFLVQEVPTCYGATKPAHHNYWACTLETRSHNYWAHILQLLKPACSRAHALQQKKLLWWEACVLQLESSPSLLQLEKAHAATKAQHSHKGINRTILKINKWKEDPGLEVSLSDSVVFTLNIVVRKTNARQTDLRYSQTLSLNQSKLKTLMNSCFFLKFLHNGRFRFVYCNLLSYHQIRCLHFQSVIKLSEAMFKIQEIEWWKK